VAGKSSAAIRSVPATRGGPTPDEASATLDRADGRSLNEGRFESNAEIAPASRLGLVVSWAAAPTNVAIADRRKVGASAGATERVEAAD
jgi:hypothetical protein